MSGPKSGKCLYGLVEGIDEEIPGGQEFLQGVAYAAQVLQALESFMCVSYFQVE